MICISVIMLVYNHEEFIARAISSVLAQESSYLIELIICNDASTDKSHLLIKKAIEILPGNISVKYFNHTVNLGMLENFLFSLNQCTGDYIAICEGDDYWTEPFLIQSEADFLENHVNYNLVTGYVKEYFQGTGRFVSPKDLKSYDFSYKDMLVRNHCSTCVTMIRNFIKNKKFEYIKDMGTDSQLWIQALGKDGLGRKLPQIFGVYRRHQNSATGIRKSQAQTYKNGMDFMRRKVQKAEFWNRYYDGTANLSVLQVKKHIYPKMIKAAFQTKNLKDLIKYGINYCSAQFVFKFYKLRNFNFRLFNKN